MSSAIIRTKDRRQEGYQSFTNPNQSHNNRSNKNKWNKNKNNNNNNNNNNNDFNINNTNNSQHSINLTSITQQLPNPSPSFTNHYHNNSYINNINHNTNNHATNVANNHFSISPGPNSFKQIEQIVYDESSSRHMHDRMLFLLFNLVGRNVIVTLKSGVKYQGFFRTACTDGEMGVVLRLARRILSKNEEKTTPNPAKESFIILAKDLMDIYATNVDFSASERPSFERDTFRTDSDITDRTEIRERELHKWTPDESGENMLGIEDDLSLENSDNNSWDQFEVNRQLFGITTDFNEEIYTTKLDRSKPDFKEREKAAIALANEINRTTTTNVHMLEERGHIIDESQMDEEQLYGAVARRDPSKYMPPAIRKQLQEQQKQQQQPSSPPPPSQPPLPIPVPQQSPQQKLQPQQPPTQTQSNTTTQIIDKPEPAKESSKDTTSTTTATTATTTAKSKPTEEIKPSSPDNNNPKSEPLSNGTTTTTVTNTTAATNKSTTPVQKVNSLAKFRITEPIEVLLTKRNNNNQSSEGKKIETQMETQIVKTFRQFANNEKERLQQRKQAIFKKEMDGKVAELLKWGQNFKLNSPLPQDLIPILTNDESKRQKLAAKSVTTNNEKTKDKALDRGVETDNKNNNNNNNNNNNKNKDKSSKDKITASKISDLKSKPEIKFEDDKSQKSFSQPESKTLINNDNKSSSTTSPMITTSTDKSISVADKAPPQFPHSRNNNTNNNNNQSSSSSPSSTTSSQFKFNVKASEWKPNPNAIVTNTDKKSPNSSPFFGNRQLKKNSATLKEGFSPFHKGKSLVNPSSIAPIWNYGSRPFRHHFVTSNYDEEIYSQATVNPGYGFTSYPVAPPFRYPNAAQYGVVPQMPLQQPTPMPYMQQGFVPGVSFPTPPIPQNGAPPIYNQMQTIVPQHFGSQGFPSPGRTPMVPAGMHPQIYQPYQNPHAIPQMMRYPHEMVPQVPPNGVILGQRPMMMEPHYVPQPENNQMGKLKN